jgi:Tfp pilus assembly protein PilF
MEALQVYLARLASVIFDMLKVLGSALALLAVLVIAFGMLRSIWNVTLGRATLILPFRGDDKTGVWVSGLLAQALNEIEENWRELRSRIMAERKSAESSDVAQLVDMGRTRVNEESGAKQDQLVAPTSMEGQAIGPISFGIASFSPESLFATLDMVRSKLARRTIRGEVDMFGDSMRLSSTFTTWGGSHKPVVLTRRIERPEETLELIRDVAFCISKQRQKFKSEAETWPAYRSFLEAYLHHLRYASTSDAGEREAAVQKYQECIAVQPGYNLARYNLGILLYTRYTAADNEQAIEHLRGSSTAEQPLLKALALAGLARAYFQQVHRYGHKEEHWALWAGEASAASVQLAPEVEDTWLARGFALQGLLHYQEAIEAYQRVVNLPGDSSQERSLKSMALNNMGNIHMTHQKSLETAEALFKRALGLNRYNKMSHANLGEIRKRQGKYQEALGEFDKALELDPDYVNAHNEKGMVFLAMAHHARERDSQQQVASLLEQANQCHQKALSLVPEEQRLQRVEVQRRFAASCRESAGAGAGEAGAGESR